MPHHTHLTVRGYHLDVYRHVNNARYLEFLEEARWDYFDHNGLAEFFRNSRYGMAIVHIDIHYRRAALLGAAPVEFGTMLVAAARLRRRSPLRCGPSSPCRKKTNCL